MNIREAPIDIFIHAERLTYVDKREQIEIIHIGEITWRWRAFVP